MTQRRGRRPAEYAVPNFHELPALLADAGLDPPHAALLALVAETVTRAAGVEVAAEALRQAVTWLEGECR